MPVSQMICQHISMISRRAANHLVNKELYLLYTVPDDISQFILAKAKICQIYRPYYPRTPWYLENFFVRGYNCTYLQKVREYWIMHVLEKWCIHCGYAFFYVPTGLLQNCCSVLWKTKACSKFVADRCMQGINGFSFYFFLSNYLIYLAGKWVELIICVWV